MYSQMNIDKYKYWLSDLLFLFIALTIFYFLWLGSHPLLTPDEARYSEIAREMVISKDYITPRLNGTVFLDKPILYYWLQASAIKVFGLNEWALRLWPALIGVFGCLMAYITGRKLFSRRAGLLAAIILATCPQYYGMSHYANVDLEVAVFISSSLFAFIIAMEQQSIQQQIAWSLTSYICAGLAILTKGLIGLAFPMLIIGSWILILNKWRIIGQMRIVIGLGLIFLIISPWFFQVQQTNPEFFKHFFLNQQFSRFVSDNFNNAQPFWFYIPLVILGSFPWVIFLPSAIFYHAKLIKQDKQTNQALLFLLLWPLLIFIFFSIPHSKTIGYITPVIPPLALLIAAFLDNFWKGLSPQKAKLHLKVFMVMISVIAITEISLVATVKYFGLNTIKPLAIIINRVGEPTDEVVTYYKYYHDLPLYTQRRITVVDNWDSPAVLEGDNWHRELSDYSPKTHPWLITEPVFWQRWHSDHRIFVLVNEAEVKKFKAIAKAKLYSLGEYQGVYLYSNKMTK